jgi:magnesium transporter
VTDTTSDVRRPSRPQRAEPSGPADPAAQVVIGGRRPIAAHCILAVPQADPEATVDDAAQLLRAGKFRYAGHLAVVDRSGQLHGAIPVERLLEMPGVTPLARLAEAVPTVAPETFEESAVGFAAHRAARVIAVVDQRGFRGLVPPEALLRVLAVEHEQDVARFGGYLVRTAKARSALEERLPRRLWHRTPWLIIGLLGAMASALLTAGFEARLAQMVAVAFFVPAVVYLADAVGTQTEALVIRGISLGEPLRRVLWQEIATGALIGLVLAALFLPFAALIGGNLMLGVAVAVSLFAGATTATAVALTLPYLFARSGKDPAFGSGPLATVVQDLLSIVIYLGLVVTMVPPS